MKRIVFSCILILFTFSVFGQNTVNFNISAFKKDSDSLVVIYSIQISPCAIETGRGLYIIPEVKSGDSLLSLPGVEALGKNKEKVLSRFDRKLPHSHILTSIKKDTLLNYNIKVPYASWMDSAALIVKEIHTGHRNQSTQTIYKIKEIAEFSHSKPATLHPAVAFVVPRKEEKRRKCHGRVYLDFQVGHSVIRPNYRRNLDELAKINNAVSGVVNNPYTTLQGLYIEGYASPDGPYVINEHLAQERAQALKEYICKKFSLNDNLFRVSSVAEDWDGLSELVRVSNIPQKDKILEIISSVDIHDGREAQLMNLDKGIPYQLMLKEIFSELRRVVEYRIDYTINDYDLKQTRVLLDKNPCDLSQFELYNLAMSYGPGTKEYNHILLEIIPRYFPEEEIANANAAAILIENGELTTARRYLKKAGETASVLNNTGAILMLEGDFGKAGEYFKKAQMMGSAEAANNLQELEAKCKNNKLSILNKYNEKE